MVVRHEAFGESLWLIPVNGLGRRTLESAGRLNEPEIAAALRAIADEIEAGASFQPVGSLEQIAAD